MTRSVLFTTELIDQPPADSLLGSTIGAIRQQLESSASEKLEIFTFERLGWRFPRLTTNRIEEWGLLYRLNRNEAYFEQSLELVSRIAAFPLADMDAKDVPLYDDLFAAEFLLGLIQFDEHFGARCNNKQRAELEKAFEKTFQALLTLVQKKDVYATPVEGRLAWNHSVITHVVLGLGALKRNRSDGDENQALQRAIRWLTGYLNHGLTVQGECREGAFYSGFVRNPILRFGIALKRHKGIDMLGCSALRNHIHWLLSEFVPSRAEFVLRNDADQNPTMAVSALLLYAHVYSSSEALALWLAAVGESGTKTYGNPRVHTGADGSLASNYLLLCSMPQKLATQAVETDVFASVPPVRIHRETGVVNVASASTDTYFSVQASRYTSLIHSQADHGHIYMYSGSDILLCDAGPADDRAVGSPSQAEGHNSLFIDGQSMARAGKGWATQSVLESVHRTGEFVIAQLNLAPAYYLGREPTDVLYFKRIVVIHHGSPSFAFFHDRVHVDFDTDQKHEYEYRFHTAAGNASLLREAEPACFQGSQNALYLIPAVQQSMQIQAEPYEYKGRVRTQMLKMATVATSLSGGFVLLPVALNRSIEALYPSRHSARIALDNGFHIRTAIHESADPASQAYHMGEIRCQVSEPQGGGVELIVAAEAERGILDERSCQLRQI